MLLNLLQNKIQRILCNRFSAKVSWQKIRIIGLFKLEVQTVSMVKNGFNFECSTVVISIRPLNLIVRKKACHSMYVRNCTASLVPKASGLRKTEEVKSNPRALIINALNIVEKLIDSMPSKIRLEDITIQLPDGRFESIIIKKASLNYYPKEFSKSLNTSKDIPFLNGELDLDIRMKQSSGSAINLITIKEISASTLFSAGHLNTPAVAIGFKGNAHRLIRAAQAPKLSQFEGRTIFRILEDGIDVIDDSYFLLNKIKFHFWLALSFRNVGIFDVGLKLLTCPIHEILVSVQGSRLKVGLLSELSGSFGFIGKLQFPLTNVAQRTFDVQVDNQLSYKKGEQEAFRPPLSDSDSNYVNISAIPTWLKDAIVLCEDPNFYIHHGIDTTLIGQAIHQNIFGKRILRGASTISMQLMKNLFLDHSRSIGVKIEQMLLAWILENVYLVDKSKILEVYLNIIQFGETLYGIFNAARYYFNKNVSSLTLTECFLLTYIVPRPTKFSKALRNDPVVLGSELRYHFNSLAGEMLRRNKINEIEYAQIDDTIYIFCGDKKICLRLYESNMHPYLLSVFENARDIWIRTNPRSPRPIISCCYRSEEQQLMLYNQGRLGHGKIVTNAKPGESPHNFLPSFAFDVNFRSLNGRLDWSRFLFEEFWGIIRGLDRDKLICWGGDFVTLKDFPHFEISNWRNVAK